MSTSTTCRASARWDFGAAAKCMTHYKCYLLDPQGRIRHVEAIDSNDDDGARERAASLLQEYPRLQAIELWDGGRRLTLA